MHSTDFDSLPLVQADPSLYPTGNTHSKHTMAMSARLCYFDSAFDYYPLRLPAEFYLLALLSWSLFAHEFSML